MRTAKKIAVIGAGPVGLAFALSAASLLPQASITLFDARPEDADLSRDPRALALSLGSIQMLEGWGVWADMAQAYKESAIKEVRVSNSGPSLFDLLGLMQPAPEVIIRAHDEGVPQLGTVVRYGALTGALQHAWVVAASKRPDQLFSRFGTKVRNAKSVEQGVELDAGICDVFDLAVVAEGGLFEDHAKQADTASVRRAYGQHALVGEVVLQGSPIGVAFERFTSQGPLALLPLPRLADDPIGTHRASLVWCLSEHNLDLAELSATQQCSLLQTMLPADAGRVVSVSALKRFELGANAYWRSILSSLGFTADGNQDQQGTVVRIGNAAQTLHPVAGQGLNLGLRDAMVLTQCLRRELTLADALKRFERERLPDRWLVLAATDLLARGFVWSGLGAAAARALGLAALPRLGKMKSSLAHAMMFGHAR